MSGKKTLVWLAVFLLIGIASGYSYTSTGFRAPWFATDDGSFNTSTGTVNISNASGVLPRAQHDANTMYNNSDNNMNGKNITNGTNYSAKSIGGVIYADQYATLQDAINASSVGDTVRVIGTHTLTANLSIPSYRTIDFTGATIYLSGASAILNKNWSATAHSDKNINIIGGTFKGINQISENQNGTISFRSVDYSSIRYTTILDYWGWAGIYCACENGFIEYNNVSNISKTSDTMGNGIYPSASRNMTISYNTIKDNRGRGIFLEDPTGYGDNVLYNLLERNDRNGIDVNHDWTHVIGNTIVGNGTATGNDRGINGGGSNLIIANNYVTNTRYHGIDIVDGYGYQNNTMYGNTLRNLGTSQGLNDGGYNDIAYANNLFGVTVTKTYVNSSHYNNPGQPLFNFGNSATAPTAFGAGDTYFNSTSGYPCWRNATSWNRYNDSVGGC